MKKFLKTSFCFMTVTAISMSGFFTLNANADEESSKILNTRCTACHGLKKLEKANHDKKEWEETIIRMVNKKKFGPKLTQTQIEKLAEYISSAR
jgi:cytochrome c5